MGYWLMVLAAAVSGETVNKKSGTQKRQYLLLFSDGFAQHWIFTEGTFESLRVPQSLQMNTLLLLQVFRSSTGGRQ